MPTTAPSTSSGNGSAAHMSPATSTTAMGGAGSGSRISHQGGGSTARRKVATRPVWARYDAPSPPTSPYSAAVASADADVPTFSALPPPHANGSPGASNGSTQADTASPSTVAGPARSRAPSQATSHLFPHAPAPPKSDADSESVHSTDEKGPKRFWTFTMPGMRWERQGRSQASGLRVDLGDGPAEGQGHHGHEAAADISTHAAANNSTAAATTPTGTQRGSGAINKLHRGWSRPGPSATGGSSRQNTQLSGSSAQSNAQGGGSTPANHGSGGIQKRRREKRTASNKVIKPRDSDSSYSSSDDDYDEGGRREEDFVGSSAMRDAAASVGASGLMMPWRKGGAGAGGPAGATTHHGDLSSGGPASPLSGAPSEFDGKSGVAAHRGQDEEQGDSLTRSQQRHGSGEAGSEELRITIPLPSPGGAGAMGTGMERNDSFTRHQPQTPGWSSPWRPSPIYEAGGEGNSIDLGGGYIFSRANGNFVTARYGEKMGGGGGGGGGGGDGTEGGYGSTSDRRKNSRSNGGGGGFNEKASSPSARRAARKQAFEQFLLHNPFVPLLFRIVNLAFTTATLAVAIRLHQILHTEGASAAVGSSPVLAIVIACPTLVHVCSQIYLEYGSKPIGLWSVSSKLTYTMVDLLAISFWSAELSLAFDNYFTSSITCTSFNTAFLQAAGCTSVGGSLLSNPNRKGIICRLQGALIGLVFVSLVAYIVVFTVSLFRIFERVSSRRGG